MKRLTLMLTAFAALFATLTACAQKKQSETVNKGNEKILVAYFSATGTTEGVAKQLAEVTKGELYKIDPEQAYSSADLDWTVPTSRSCVENDNPESRPAFKRTKETLDGYDVIYLGYPIWWDQAPRIINTFIEAYGLKGKTVRPFATSGGSGVKNSVKALKAAYPDVNWQEGALLNSPSTKEIEAWVNE